MLEAASFFFYGEVMHFANRVVFSHPLLPTEHTVDFTVFLTHYRHHVILLIVLEQTADSMLVTV